MSGRNLDFLNFFFASFHCFSSSLYSPSSTLGGSRGILVVDKVPPTQKKKKVYTILGINGLARRSKLSINLCASLLYKRMKSQSDVFWGSGGGGGGIGLLIRCAPSFIQRGSQDRADGHHITLSPPLSAEGRLICGNNEVGSRIDILRHFPTHKETIKCPFFYII